MSISISSKKRQWHNSNNYEYNINDINNKNENISSEDILYQNKQIKTIKEEKYNKNKYTKHKPQYKEYPSFQQHYQAPILLEEDSEVTIVTDQEVDDEYYDDDDNTNDSINYTTNQNINEENVEYFNNEIKLKSKKYLLNTIKENNTTVSDIDNKKEDESEQERIYNIPSYDTLSIIANTINEYIDNTIKDTKNTVLKLEWNTLCKYIQSKVPSLKDTILDNILNILCISGILYNKKDDTIYHYLCTDSNIAQDIHDSICNKKNFIIPSPKAQHHKIETLYAIIDKNEYNSLSDERNSNDGDSEMETFELNMYSTNIPGYIHDTFDLEHDSEKKIYYNNSILQHDVDDQRYHYQTLFSNKYASNVFVRISDTIDNNDCRIYDDTSNDDISRRNSLSCTEDYKYIEQT